jgi:hypothetical protein
MVLSALPCCPRVVVAYRKQEFLELAESYAWLNPHLSLRVSWNGETRIDVKASNPTWDKWLPSWPTSPHWYDKSRFRRYMAAHIANRGNITVREFVSEFRGLSSTAKQRLVLEEIGASHVSLHDFFGRHKANGDNIARLLAALKEQSNPVRPAHLGVIGKGHLYRRMEAAGGNPKTFTYNRSDVAKVIPNWDLLTKVYTGLERGWRLKRAVEKLDKIDMKNVEPPADLEQRVRKMLKKSPWLRWDAAVKAIVDAARKGGRERGL